MHLPVTQQGIDQHAHIVHGHVVEDLHHPRVDIDFHYHGMASIGRAQGDRFIEDTFVQARLHIARQLASDIGHSRDLGKRHGETRFEREDAIRVTDAFLGGFQHDGGDPACLGQDLSSRDIRCRAAHRHGARIECAVTGQHAIRVTLHDVDIFHRQLKDLRDNLCVACGMTVALRHRPAEQRHLAIGMHAQMGALPTAAVEADFRQDGGIAHAYQLKVAGHADADIPALLP